MNRALLALICLVFLLSSCPAEPGEHYAKAAPVELTKDGRKWAAQTLKKLSLEEKVGQMLAVRYYMDFENYESDSYKQIREQLQKYHLGTVLLTVRVDGPTLLKNPPLEAAFKANELQRDSNLPLLIAADFERGCQVVLALATME